MIWGRLGGKLFLSYLIVILVGVLSLAVVAEFISPAALNRHMAQMEGVMGPMMGGMMGDLAASFRRALNETLLVAATLSTVAAALVSLFVTRRLLRPIQTMQQASRRIADGQYGERVTIAGNDELAELGRSFNQMAEALDETETRRRRLIGDVAHELRTPLAGIRSVMEGLQDGVLPPDPPTFHSVEREVSRLQRLVQDLEELSKAEAGQTVLHLERANPLAFVGVAVERLRLQYEEAELSLEIHHAPDLPDVCVDTVRMTQVMLNLLGNALQYTPSGGWVVVTVQRDDGQVAIHVSDDGIGIPPEALPHIFERFYRVDRSRSRVGGGSGIGLTISKHLVEAHGGSLGARSDGPGTGSTFSVTLPIAS